MRVRLAAVTLFVFGGALAAPPTAPGGAAPAIPEAPVAAKRPVVDEYHGVKVEDDYRWLEDWSDPAVRAWSDGQGHHARASLDAMPEVAAMRKRLTELEGTAGRDFFALTWRGPHLFALLERPPHQQPMLVELQSTDDREGRVLLDPAALPSTKGGAAIDFFVPSQSGALIAVSISEGGSEEGSLHVIASRDGKELPEVIPRVNGGTAGGSVAWLAGDSLFYTRYPRGKERPAADHDFYQQVWRHRVGTPVERDQYAFGKELPRIAEIALHANDEGDAVIASVENGDGGEYAHWLWRQSDDQWTPIAGFADEVSQVRFGHDGSLFLLSRHGAPRGQVLKASVQDPALAHAKHLVAQQKGVIESIVAGTEHLYLTMMQGGPSELWEFDLAGRRVKVLPTEPVSSVQQVEWAGGDQVLVRTESFVHPASWAAWNGRALAPTKLARQSSADFSDVEVTRVSARSKDGTRVPVTVLRKKGARPAGGAKTVLYGYGGFAIPTRPGFQEQRKAWLERGGVWAIANLRGGAEFGEAWHQAGSKTHKQNTFDDFAAAAKHLVELGYTKPDKLAVMGGSNGGLTVGALVTQHPELARAAVATVGLFDALRIERSTNGVFNVTEYGSTADEAQFQALHAYSPYHHVSDGTKYPATLMMTGANDPRVDPMHSRKMTARLQAAQEKTTAADRPILLRTAASGGHGLDMALSERIAEQADSLGFLWHELE